MADKRHYFKVCKVWQIEIEYTFGGFILTFNGQTAAGKSAVVKAELHFCELSTLARRMWAAIKDRQSKVDMCKQALRGEQQ